MAQGALVLVGWCSLAAGARAENCKVLRYTFQPDCYRAADSAACAQKIERLDLGPQIAVWVETGDRKFVDTLMVTNMVAARGLGNRPGRWDFLSGPKFPYGKRQMALPIWAYARNVLYPQVVMQDGQEDWLGWHETHSTEDPYYCRPVRAQEINVDAITCPTKFNSAKGRLEPAMPMVYYPPRNDLTMFNSRDCDKVSDASIPCKRSAEMYATMNTLDAVAAATPAYGKPYSGAWMIPADQPPGDYALMIEVNKEFDINDAHKHPSFEDPRLTGYGMSDNFGQPGVVWRVPVRLDGAGPTTVTATTSFGYGAWDGASGSIKPRDGTISSNVPGSGEGRLLEMALPGGSETARVVVSVEQCSQIIDRPDGGSPPDGDGCNRLEVPPAVGDLSVDPTGEAATSARLLFTNASGGRDLPVAAYDVRYRVGTSMTVDQFLNESIKAPQVAVGAPGTPASVALTDLKPATSYVLGVRYLGACGVDSELAFFSFNTAGAKFKQISGCFIATAAYGSAMEPDVEAMRQVRDRLTSRSGLFAAAADLYYRSGPAAAQVIKQSDTARALVRRLLAPAAALAEIATAPRQRP